jgi:transcription elongation factor GreA
MPDGPAVLGRAFHAPRAGVYIIELPTPLPRAPIELTRVGKWLERVPNLSLDGARPTSKELAARISAFWIPSATALYVGSTTGSVAAKIAALEVHVLGDPRPHAPSQWLKTLSVESMKVWWATTTAPEEYEDALIAAFGEAVPAEERADLPDTAMVLPFANLRTPTGERKKHGIAGASLPEEPAQPGPPTRVVELAPGDAEGARAEARSSGTTRRTNRRPGVAIPVARAKASTKPEAEPTRFTAGGHARLEAELAELVRDRRPEVIARVKAARELGDLKENAEYASAREEQSFLEGRIQTIEAQLRGAEVAAEPYGSDRVVMGSRVTLEVAGVEITLTIVGTTESDPDAGRVSTASPVGRALLGKSPGEEALVRTPGGEVRYRVIAIG